MLRVEPTANNKRPSTNDKDKGLLSYSEYSSWDWTSTRLPDLRSISAR